MEHGYKFYLDKGISETNEGKFDEALHSLNQAAAINPGEAMPYFSMAIVFHHLGELESAYANYTKAIELNHKMIDAYFNRAQVLLADKEADEDKLKSAISDFDKALEFDSKFIDALYYKAVVLKKLEQYEEAIKTLDKVLAIDPKAVYSNALKKLILQKYLKQDLN